MEGVSEPTDGERRQFIILSLLCLSWILLATVGESRGRSVLEAVPPGEMTILAAPDGQGRLWGTPLEERGPVSPKLVRLNTADREGLIACPGIGAALADRILAERTRGPFRDWEDLRRRVTGIGPVLIKRLQEAGVRLDP